jgi:PIN domain nuclease of toxin-antitoxin system
MLDQLGRVALPMNIRSWVEEALSKPGISLAPLTSEIAIESSNLPGNLQGDPVDSHHRSDCSALERYSADQG